MANQKPLPALPSRPNLVGSLSVDARAHRSRLIRHFLSEIPDPGIQSRLDGWTFALEEALDELGQCIARGDWLPGIRRRKEAAYLTRHNKRLAEKTSKVSDPKKGREASRDSHTQSPSEDKRSTLPSTPLAFPPLDDSYSRLENNLQQLQTHIARRNVFSSEPQHSLLLLCLASSGRQVQFPTEPHPSNAALLPSCTFFPGKYLLPSTAEHIGTTVLYGLNEWDETLSPCIIGGTFSFKGIESFSQHELLAKILRISIYVHLSLLLEQQFLSDSHVHIRFPRPRVHPSPSVPSRPGLEAPQPGKTRHRTPLSPSGLWSFLSRKTGLFNRAHTINQPQGRGSLDLITSSSDLVHEVSWSPRASADGGVSRHLRRLSLIGDRGSNLQKGPSEDKPEENDGPFTLTLKRIERSRSLLSTSVGVTFLPPSLIVDLAAKEHQFPKRRLKADERAGLAGLLGWTGKDAAGKGMSGIDGFLRQQEFSLLQMRHVPLPVSVPTNDASSTTTKLTRSSSSSTVSQQVFPTCCGRPKWVTYRYYSSDPREDRPLGEAILDYFATANFPCEQPGCTYKLGQHETRLVHNGSRITVNVKNVHEDFQLQSSMLIDIWESCAICNAETPRIKMGDGTYLLSYGKFLELFIYSSSICTLTPPLCGHTKPEPGPTARLPDSRLNLLHHFAVGTSVVTFSLSTIKDIFELQIPRLQMQQSISATDGKGSSSEHEHLQKGDPEEDKRLLRREIKRWWEGINDHMDKLEHLLAGEPNSLLLKALPRLPSTADAYDDIDTTPKIRPLTELPPIPPNTPASITSTQPIVRDGTGEEQKTPTAAGLDETAFQKDETPTPSVLTKESSTDEQDPTELLANLRRTFQRTEHALYGQLSRTPITSLNDVRRAFLSSAKGAQKRLTAWQKKHFKNRPEVMKELKLDLMLEEPEWWMSGYHVIPGSNAIVKEDDWGSIIAFTLSSLDYHRELANLSMNRPPSNSHIMTPPPGPSRTHSSGSSFFTSGSGYKLFGSSANPQLDPDREDIIWHEPESYSAVVSRKEHPRDVTSILSIREVLRQKSPGGGTVGSGLGPADTMSGLPRSKSSEQVNLQSVYAKPDVGLSMQAADGQVSLGQVNTEQMGRILHGLEAGSLMEAAKPESSLTTMDVGKSGPSIAGAPSVAVNMENTEEGNEATIVDPPVHATSPSPDQFGTATSALVETHIRRGKASSIISLGSEATILKGKEENEHISTAVQPPIPPPKEIIKHGHGDQSNKMKELPMTPSTHGSTTPVPSSFTSTITSTLHMAMRYMLNHPDSSKSGPPPPPKKLHNLLLVDSNNIDERPHIKYDWTIGKRLKFSCTVYYARQFDLMRKRCGIDDMFLKSLSRSINWEAVGGKSRSNFWKTMDERFIIKSLVDTWNVADLQVLLELAPSYFRYMESTTNKASVLAKLVGFYTVEIRNLETGAVQSKADLLVMENLFYNRKVDKTFDLKGIQGRKAKAKQDGTHGSRTLFDGEWLEGQQRTLMLLRPQSKNVLREAIRSDADFLAKSNIMDYSLLLGVDEENKQIACGLVDTIGSYTFAKTLEYKAKQNLQSGKDVTVIPPTEYQERFVNALEDYFIVCPDKWSKPLDESKTISDPFLLPSVL